MSSPKSQALSPLSPDQIEILNSYTSANGSSAVSNKAKKSNTSKAISGNLSRKGNFEQPLAPSQNDSVQVKGKSSKFKSENKKQMKTVLQKLLNENFILRHKLSYVDGNQEEAKST